MAEIFFIMIFLIPAMLGTAELLHMLKVYMAFPKKTVRSYSVIILTEEDFTEKLEYSREKLEWYGWRYAERIIAVDMGLSAESRRKAFEITKRYDMVLCRAEELEEVLNEIEKE